MFRTIRLVIVQFVCILFTGLLLTMPSSTGYTSEKNPSTSAGENTSSEDEENDGDEMTKAAVEKIDKALKDLKDDATRERLNKVKHKLRKLRRHRGSSSGISKGDFNGDGFADLAIGIPHEETPAGTIDSGAVIVIYGSTTGLGHGLNGAEGPEVLPQFWSQNSPGIPGTSQAHDEFGAALASGDFNGDGFSDLAIGIPQETVTIPFNNTNLTFPNAGRVVIIYGSPHGLTATDPTVHPSQSFDFSIFGPTFSSGTQIKGNERLGTALSWGDFNGDGIGDLAIGAPGRDVTTTGAFSNVFTVQRAGEVWILFGSKPVITCRSCGVNPATGGLTRTGKPASNVAASTLPEEFINAVEFSNFFGVCRVGLPSCGLGTAVQDAGFGTVLAAGDFNGDGKTDLACGLPNLGFGGNLPGNIKNAGAVVVFSAGLIDGVLSDSRLGVNGSVLTELSGQIPFPNTGDGYGFALAVGDFNGDGRSDLAIGIPNRDVGPNTHAGVVHVRYGQKTPGNGEFLEGNPLPLTGSQIWTQNNIFNPALQHSEPNEFFGAALAAGDFNGDGKADLAIGVPLEDVIVTSPTFQNVLMAGEVDVIYGSDSTVATVGGLSITVRNPQIWTKGQTLQGTIQGKPHAGDLFGFSLSAWNFGDPSAFSGGIRGTQADLAIGAPFEDLFQISGPSAGTLVPNAGAVNVIYGSPGPFTSFANFNGLTPLGNQLWAAASPNVNSILEQDANFGFVLY